MMAKCKDGDRNSRKPDEFRKKFINNWWADLNVKGKNTCKQSWSMEFWFEEFQMSKRKQNWISSFCFWSSKWLKSCHRWFSFWLLFSKRLTIAPAELKHVQNDHAIDMQHLIKPQIRVTKKNKAKTMLFEFMHW